MGVCLPILSHCFDESLNCRRFYRSKRLSPNDRLQKWLNHFSRAKTTAGRASAIVNGIIDGTGKRSETLKENTPKTYFPCKRKPLFFFHLEVNLLS